MIDVNKLTQPLSLLINKENRERNGWSLKPKLNMTDKTAAVRRGAVHLGGAHAADTVTAAPATDGEDDVVESGAFLPTVSDPNLVKKKNIIKDGQKFKSPENL